MCKNKKIIFSICAFVLSIVFSFSFLLSKKSIVFGQSISSDYSNKDSEIVTICDADKLLELVLKTTLSSSEKTFLSDYKNLFLYNDSIPTSNVTTVMGEKLFVYAYDYSYQTAKGLTVTWSPYSVKVGNKTLLFSNISNDEYVCEFELNEIDNDIDKCVDVNYKTSFLIDKSVINSVLNLASDYVYSKVPEILREEYLQKKNEWDIQRQKYNQYQLDMAQYELDLTKYNEYLKQKKEWESESSAYSEYLIDLKAYNDYQDYLIEYQEYLDNLALYNDYLIKYSEYLSSVEKIIAENQKASEQLEYIDYIFYIMDLINTPMGKVVDGDGKESQRTLYGAINGSTVTSVLAQRADLNKIGVPTKIIDLAEQSTYKLRELFTAYFNYKEDADKYSYYSKYYKDLNTNIKQLFVALEKLYRYSTVSDLIEKKGKTEQYMILLSQLCLISRALDEKQLYNYESYLNGDVTTTPKLTNSGAKLIDENWKVDGKRSVDQVLCETYVQDFSVSCKPQVTVYPTILPLPKEIDIVENPTMPTPVSPAVKPDEVNKPGEKPSEVVEPTKPAEVKDAGDEPTEYVIPKIYEQLKQEYLMGSLTRDEFTCDVELEIEVEKKKQIGKALEITFCQENGSATYKVQVDKDCALIYDSAIPQKNMTEKYEYTFAGWKYANGNVLDLNCIKLGGRVFAYFSQQIREFTITFNVCGEKQSKVYKYGEMPTYSEIPIKQDIGDYEYSFKGWNKTFSFVTKDEEYTALFDSKKIVYDATYQREVNLSIEEDNYIINCSFSIANGIYLRAILSRAIQEDKYGNSKGIIIYDGYGITINISKDLCIELYQNNVYFLEFLSYISGENVSMYSLYLKDEYKQKMDTLTYIPIKVKGEFLLDYSALYKVDNSSQEMVKFKVENNELSFSIKSGEKYEYCTKYSVLVVPSEFVSIEVTANTVKVGDMVHILIGQIPEGVNLKKVYAKDYLGNEIEIVNNSFIMPYGANSVTVGVLCEQIEFVISFAWEDGTLIRSTRYKYGETVILPANPFKASTDTIMYFFDGWDKPIKKATCDITYYAVFSEHKIISNGIKYAKSKIELIEIGGGVALFLIIAGVVTIVVVKKRKKKKQKNSKN